MELIDKEKVVKEVERRVEAIRMAFKEPGILSGVDRTYANAQHDAFKSLLSFIDTLEVKEVDLDRVINDYFNEWQNVLCDEDCCNEGGFCCVLDENVKPVNIGRCRKVAKHFYELGLNAKKGE